MLSNTKTSRGTWDCKSLKCWHWGNRYSSQKVSLLLQININQRLLQVVYCLHALPSMTQVFVLTFTTSSLGLEVF